MKSNFKKFGKLFRKMLRNNNEILENYFKKFQKEFLKIPKLEGIFRKNLRIITENFENRFKNY